MKAKSIRGSSPGAIKEAIAQFSEEGFKASLAIVFISIRQDRKELCEILSEENIDIIGATSSGEFINEFQTEGEIAILFLDIKKTDYSILFQEIGEHSLEEASSLIAKQGLQKFSNPAFILFSTMLSADGKMVDGEILIRSMVQETGPDLSLFGGMAGDDISFTGTYIFSNQQSTDYGVAALVINEDKISLHGMAVSGWKPVGVTKTITKSESNLLYTIDHMPALEVYMRFLGEKESSADNQVSFFDSIGVHYPFQLERENRLPKMCNPIGYDKEKKALICESEVPQGSRFRFSTPPDFDIIDSVLESALQLKEEVAIEADALLIFSCAGRLSSLGPMAREENEGLSNIWKVPMAGFYTYGEFGKATDGKHDFHSTTCSWVVLKEK